MRHASAWVARRTAPVTRRRRLSDLAAHSMRTVARPAAGRAPVNAPAGDRPPAAVLAVVPAQRSRTSPPLHRTLLRSKLQRSTIGSMTASSFLRPRRRVQGSLDTQLTVARPRVLADCVFTPIFAYGLFDPATSLWVLFNPSSGEYHVTLYVYEIGIGIGRCSHPWPCGLGGHASRRRGSLMLLRYCMQVRRLRL